MVVYVPQIGGAQMGDFVSPSEGTFKIASTRRVLYPHVKSVMPLLLSTANKVLV